ncbi:MAG: ribosome biogenesis GTPase Der [Thermodesulfovibrionales bacterium]|nr:ribosome biogenesis GTPase Der [Thermodesulfovibrionales bacterium]
MSAIVAIVGMPNVGKSTLFNRIIRIYQQNKDFISALTDKTPGITRDKIYAQVQYKGIPFTIIDTGGLFFEDPSTTEIDIEVMKQAMSAMEEADLILHVVDSKVGLNPYELEISQKIRQKGKKFFVVVNKIDSSKSSSLGEFYLLGGQIIFLSALTGEGVEELMDKITENLPIKELKKDLSYDQLIELPKVAVIGRPNVGKSTFINSLLGKKRLIVSSLPGTTRDSIDTICSYYGKTYLFIDTAGIRKNLGKPFSKQRFIYKSSYCSKTLIERMCVLQTIKSIQRADIVILMLDAKEGITNQDQKIASIILEYGKGVILLFNKWDLIEEPDKFYKTLYQTILDKFWFLSYAPILTVSALNKNRITKIFPLIDEINSNRKRILSEEELENLLLSLSSKLSLIYKTKELKIKKIKQTNITPPSFDIYINNISLIKKNIIHFIEKIFREKINFRGTPIRIFFKCL